MAESSFISFNGKLSSIGSFNLGLENRSFRYGDGLFESIRSRDGKMPFWDFHIQRLKSGLDILGITYSHINWNDLEKEAESLIENNEHTNSARLRLTVFRTGAGNYFPESNEMSYCIESSELNSKEFKLNEKGINADLYTRIKKPLNVLSMVKSANAQLFVMAAKFAQEKGLEDAFLVNTNNDLVEAVSSNLFIIKNNQVYTPALSTGCLPGIMRMVIISMLAKKNIKVSETKISPSDLILADEIFLTNSIQGIQWVGGFQTKRFYKKYSEIINNELNKIYLNS
ncbi:MAG: aminotransferase class IV [Salibacteraceae bacterium]